MSRVAKALELLDLLSTRGVRGVSELAQHLDVTERTVHRLRLALEEAGYQIETVMGPSGGYRLLSSSQVKPVEFNSKEIHNIRKGIESILASQDASIGSDFVLAFSKLIHQLDVLPHEMSLSSYHTVRLNVDKEVYQRNIEILERAIQRQESVTFDYEKKPHLVKSVSFDPYELYIVDQKWYLSGYERGKSKQKSYRVSRIKKASLMGVGYAYDKNFPKKHSLSHHGFEIKPTRVSVILSGRSDLLEYIWGEDQVIDHLGGDKYKMSVTFSNEYAAKGFILSGGSAIRVVEPESLVQWIQEEAQKIMQTYQ